VDLNLLMDLEAKGFAAQLNSFSMKKVVRFPTPSVGGGAPAGLFVVDAPNTAFPVADTDYREAGDEDRNSHLSRFARSGSEGGAPDAGIATDSMEDGSTGDATGAQNGAGLVARGKADENQIDVEATARLNRVDVMKTLAGWDHEAAARSRAVAAHKRSSMAAGAVASLKRKRGDDCGETLEFCVPNITEASEITDQNSHLAEGSPRGSSASKRAKTRAEQGASAIKAIKQQGKIGGPKRHQLLESSLDDVSDDESKRLNVLSTEDAQELSAQAEGTIFSGHVMSGVHADEGLDAGYGYGYADDCDDATDACDDAALQLADTHYAEKQLKHDHKVAIEWFGDPNIGVPETDAAGAIVSYNPVGCGAIRIHEGLRFRIMQSAETVLSAPAPAINPRRRPGGTPLRTGQGNMIPHAGSVAMPVKSRRLPGAPHPFFGQSGRRGLAGDT
jgi:hypothetical protein